ncbi:hypothetical protein Tco_1193681 [Tanacetum coccineum]
MKNRRRSPPREEEQVFLDELERLKRQEKEANKEAEALKKELHKKLRTWLYKKELLRLAVLTFLVLNTFPLEDIYQNSSDGIFTTSSYDDEGAVADFTNLETVVNVSPIPTSRIISSHPSALILGKSQSRFVNFLSETHFLGNANSKPILATSKLQRPNILLVASCDGKFCGFKITSYGGKFTPYLPSMFGNNQLRMKGAPSERPSEAQPTPLLATLVKYLLRAHRSEKRLDTINKKDGGDRNCMYELKWDEFAKENAQERGGQENIVGEEEGRIDEIILSMKTLLSKLIRRKQIEGTDEQIESTDEQRKGSSNMSQAKAVSREKEKAEVSYQSNGKTKSPWKLKVQDDKAEHLEEINQNVVIRSNGQKRYFSTLMRVLSIFDREYLNVVYQLGTTLVTETGFSHSYACREEVSLRKKVLLKMLELKLESEEDRFSTHLASLVKSWLVQDQTVLALASPKANELTIPEQTATGKGTSNPFMAGSLPKTTKPT